MIDQVLLVCTGNICRSPMAEALLRHAMTDRLPPLSVSSAGLSPRPEQPADPVAQRLMQRLSLCITRHRARQITLEMTIDADLILVMEAWQKDAIVGQWPSARGKVHGLGKWGDFDIQDPFRLPQEEFETALRLIQRGISQWRTAIERIN